MPFPLFVLATALIATATVAVAWRLSSRPALAAGAGATGAAGLLLFIGPGYFDCFVDDAYITYRYSENLASGLGPTWNSTGRVEGYTNFSMMAILAGVAKLGGSVVEWAPVIGFLSLLATFGFIYAIWRHWRDSDPQAGLSSPVLPVLAFIGLALTDGTAHWGFSGLETPLFAATMTGGAYAYMRERAQDSLVPWSAFVLAAASMTRPEGLIAAAVTGLFVASGVLTGQDKGRAVKKTVLWGAVFAALYGPYFLWRYTYYDYLLPNTFYAKTGSALALYERGLDYVQHFGLRYHFIPLLFGLALLAARDRLRHDAVYLLALLGAMLAGTVIEGGDAFPHGRFMMPLLPLLYLGGLAGFATMLRRLTTERMTGAFAAGIVALGALSLYPGLEDQIPCRTNDQLEQRRALAEWINEDTPQDFTVAAYAVGALGYYTDRDMLDLFGLNDVTIAHTEVPALGQGFAGHEKYNNDYVLGTVQPEIIVPNDAEAGPISTEEFQARFDPPELVTGRVSLFVDPRMWEMYEIRSVNAGGYWFNFLQRTDTLAPATAR